MNDARRHIVIVDRNPAALGSLTDLLISEGYFVMPAADSREVLAFTRQLSVDLALLDLDVLKRDALKTRQRLACDHPDVPVIFAAAHSRLPAALRNGSPVLLHKPIQLPRLRRTIGVLLRPPPRPRRSRNRRN